MPFNKPLQAVFTGRGVNYEASSLLVLDHCLDFKRLGLHCLVEISCFGSQKKQDLSSVSLETVYIYLCWYFNWHEHKKINKNYFCFSHFAYQRPEYMGHMSYTLEFAFFVLSAAFKDIFPLYYLYHEGQKVCLDMSFECKVTHIDRYND